MADCNSSAGKSSRWPIGWGTKDGVFGDLSLSVPAIWEDRTLGDDHQAVEHVPAFSADSLDLGRVADDLGPGADVAVFVDDRVIDDGAVADADWGSAGFVV